MASQVERVLDLLRSRGERGLNTAELQELPTADGGAPVLRLAARIGQLKDAGYTITSGRESNGTSTYQLVGEPERALSHTNDPPLGMQADPGSVPSQEGVRSAAPAESHSLFDASVFAEHGSYKDTQAA